MKDNIVKKNISLATLIPTKAMVALYDVRKEEADLKEYSLRPFDLDDRMWLQEVFGDQIEAVFREVQMDNILRIVYHQLEDKSDFRAITVKTLDENGEDVETKVGGYKLLRHAIKDPGQEIEVMEALLKCLGISDPILTPEAKAELADAKKKVMKAASKKKSKKRTGVKSGT